MSLPGRVAGEYHSLTKYSEEAIGSLPGIDWSKQPLPYKEIVSSGRIALRPYARGRPDALEPLGALASVLFHGNGVTGMLRLPDGQGHFLRASPSAGALYPTEVYVALGDFGGAAPGLYNYQVRDHELVMLWEGDHLPAIRAACGDDGHFDGCEACLVLTGVFWRSAWRYQERGYRRVLLDTGHVLANLVMQAGPVGLAAQPLQGFVDDAVNGCFFFDGVREAVLACVPLRSRTVPSPPAALWSSPTAESNGLAAAVLRDEADLAGSATAALHAASSCAAPLPVAHRGRGAGVTGRSIRLAPPPPEVAVSQAIAARRSARRYRGAPIPLADLGRALGFAFCEFGTREAGLLRAHVVALRVDGLDAGVYEVEGRGEALLPLALGDVGERLQHASIGQEIAGQCAAALVLSAPADEARALYGDRAYRNLHMEAGVLGERLQIAASAFGLGACGIAGFYDDEVARLLGIPVEDWVLYLVTVGRS